MTIERMKYPDYVYIQGSRTSNLEPRTSRTRSLAHSFAQPQADTHKHACRRFKKKKKKILYNTTIFPWCTYTTYNLSIGHFTWQIDRKVSSPGSPDAVGLGREQTARAGPGHIQVLDFVVVVLLVGDVAAGRATHGRTPAAAVGVRVRPLQEHLVLVVVPEAELPDPRAGHGEVLGLGLLGQVNGYTGQVEREDGGGADEGRGRGKLPHGGDGCSPHSRGVLLVTREQRVLVHFHVDVDVEIVLEVVAAGKGGRARVPRPSQLDANETRGQDRRGRGSTAAAAAAVAATPTPGTALVMDQVVPAPKAHLAVLALEGLFVLVDEQVSL
jgi:hypothetical protein